MNGRLSLLIDHGNPTNSAAASQADEAEIAGWRSVEFVLRNTQVCGSCFCCLIELLIDS